MFADGFNLKCRDINDDLFFENILYAAYRLQNALKLDIVDDFQCFVGVGVGLHLY